MGKTQYEWLYRALCTLSEAVLRIEIYKSNGNGGYKLGFAKTLNLLHFEYYADIQVYEINIDPRWQRIYGSREFALIDWDKRLKISQSQDMAKALQRLIAASNDAVQRYRLDQLKAQFEYSGRLRDFKNAIDRSLRELERLAIIKSGEIGISTRGNDQLVIHR